MEALHGELSTPWSVWAAACRLPYAASKAGVWNLTRTTAPAWAGDKAWTHSLRNRMATMQATSPTR